MKLAQVAAAAWLVCGLVVATDSAAQGSGSTSGSTSRSGAGAGAGASQGSSAPKGEGKQSFEVSLGVGHTDNFARADEDAAVAKTYANLGLSSQTTMNRERVDGQLNGSVTYSDYNEPGVTTGLTGSILGSLTVNAVPRHLNWVTSAELGSVRASILEPISPVNRERLFVASTGPDVFLPLGPRTTLNLGARVEDRRWKSLEQLESDTVSQTLGFSREVSATQSFGLRLENRDVNYDDPASLPYDESSWSVEYDRQLASGGLSFGVGRTELEYAGQKRDGPLLDLSWDRGIGTRSRLSVFGYREFQDAGDQFADGSITRLGTEGDATLNSEPRARSTVGMVYGIGRERAQLSFEVSANRDRVAIETPATSPLTDRESVRTGVDFSYPFGPAWSMSMGASRTREKVPDLGGVAKQKESFLDFSRTLGRTLSLSFRYDRYDIESDFGTDGVENRFLASITWAKT